MVFSRPSFRCCASSDSNPFAIRCGRGGAPIQRYQPLVSYCSVASLARAARGLCRSPFSVRHPGRVSAWWWGQPSAVSSCTVTDCGPRNTPGSHRILPPSGAASFFRLRSPQREDGSPQAFEEIAVRSNKWLERTRARPARVAVVASDAAVGARRSTTGR